MMIHPAVLSSSALATLKSEQEKADLIYWPSPKGFGTDFGSVTFKSSFAEDAIFRAMSCWKRGVMILAEEVYKFRVAAVYRQRLDNGCRVLSMP